MENKKFPCDYTILSVGRGLFERIEVILKHKDGKVLIIQHPQYEHLQVFPYGNPVPIGGIEVVDDNHGRIYYRGNKDPIADFEFTQESLSITPRDSDCETNTKDPLDFLIEYWHSR